MGVLDPWVLVRNLGTFDEKLESMSSSPRVRPTCRPDRTCCGYVIGDYGVADRVAESQ